MSYFAGKITSRKSGVG